jgi:hypothetical protein
MKCSKCDKPATREIYPYYPGILLRDNIIPEPIPFCTEHQYDYPENIPNLKAK